MSSSGHRHSRHHRKSAIGRFFDRLSGKKPERTSSRSHTSGFPGISLPRDFDPSQVQQQKEEEHKPIARPEPDVTEMGRDFSEGIPDKVQEFKNGAARFKPAKKGLFESIRLYFKRRALRREERRLERYRRKMKRRHQREYRKAEVGRSPLKKIFNWSEENEADKERKVPLFSQHSPFFRNLTITVNSVMVFIISYVLVYLFYWLTSMLVASWYGLDSILYYYDLEFNNHSTLWNRFNILMVTGIPPFMCLFLGIFLMRVVLKKSRFVGLQKLFILWSGFHLMNHFFGAFPSGVVTAEGFGYVAAWMYMNTAFKFLFSIISLFILAGIGYYSAQNVLETSDSVNRIKTEHRVNFIFMQLALPWLIATVILLLLRLPRGFEYPYETLMFFSMVFLVIPPFFNEKVKPKLNLVKIKKKRYINFGYLAMMLVLLAFLRIMLGIGLHFMIQIDISITPVGI